MENNKRVLRNMSVGENVRDPEESNKNHKLASEMESQEFITFHKPEYIATEDSDTNEFSQSTAEFSMYKHSMGYTTEGKSPFSGSTMFGEEKERNNRPSSKSQSTAGPETLKQSKKPETNGMENTQPHDSQERLLFFNYHEYFVNKYELLENKQYGEHEHSLTITHFPNPYVELSSKKFRNTRIVRVPRVYDTAPANRYPQFSTVPPGFEPAALLDPSLVAGQSSLSNYFIPKGKFYNQIFGYSSVTPLSNLMTTKEFEQIVSVINTHLKRAYDPLNLTNVAMSILNFVTIWTFDELVRNRSKKELDALEKYVETVNETKLQNRNIRIISPRKSGYICVCIG